MLTGEPPVAASLAAHLSNRPEYVNLELNLTWSIRVLSPELLAILRCPDDRTTLSPIDEGLLSRLNRAVAAGTLRNRAGRTVEEPLDGGLMRQAGDLVYPLHDQIPVLLKDDAIPLDQL